MPAIRVEMIQKSPRVSIKFTALGTRLQLLGLHHVGLLCGFGLMVACNATLMKAARTRPESKVERFV